MLKQIARLFIAAAILMGSFALPTASLAKNPGISDPTQGSVSPEGMLNVDGTLNLSSGFSGSLNIAGWSVQIDPQRGPVFAPADAVQNTQAPSPALGTWSDLGGGGAALNSTVQDVAILGSDVYVGGLFVNADGNPEADYIARWDGANWHALGSNGSGNGALDGAVTELDVSGTDLYVGGNFYTVYNGVSPVAGGRYIAKWDGASWSALGNNGSGGPSLNSNITALDVSGSNVYVGGYFTNVNNGGVVIPEADYVAKWDGANWSALGGAGDGALTAGSYIYSLAVNGSNVFIGGHFDNVAGIPEADHIAMWNGASWSALGSNGAGNGAFDFANSYVYALAVSGSTLYAGGYFYDVNNGVTNLGDGDFLVKWDGANWGPVSTNSFGWPAVGYTVYDLTTDGTDLYVAGAFTSVTNTDDSTLESADKLAKWDGATWSALGNNGAGEGSLYNADSGLFAHYATSVAVSGSDVYVGGQFDDLNNFGTILTQVSYVAHWDGGNWNEMGSDPNGALQGQLGPSTVEAIVVMGTDVFVGGNFTDVSDRFGNNIPEADFIAKWDGTDWSAIGGNGYGDGALTSSVYALAVDGPDLYLGGSFYGFYDTSGGYHPEGRSVLKWDGTQFSALGDDGASGSSLNGQVNALAVKDGNVYVGGYFQDVNNFGSPLPEADYVAMWDGSNWNALGSDGLGNGAISNQVHALELVGSELYVGGAFIDAGGIPEADFLARWDGANWQAVGGNGAGNGSLDYTVYALDSYGWDLYVGGEFTDVNNFGTPIQEADLIAKWDGSNWSALGHNGAGNGAFSGTSGSIWAVAVNGPDVYVGGIFGDYGDVVDVDGSPVPTADFLAKWDGTHWTGIGGNGLGDGSLNDGVYALDVSGGSLFAGGAFEDLNNNGTVLPEGDFIAEAGITPQQVLIEPFDTDLTQTRQPEFDWSDIPEATRYQLQVSVSDTFSPLALNKTVTTSMYIPTKDLAADTLFYWRVRPKIGRTYGNWSDVWMFSTGNPPSEPRASSPANNALVVGPSPLLDWRDSTVPNGVTFDHYFIQVATDEDFTNVIHQNSLSGITNSQDASAVLDSGTTYYWRVRSVSTIGDFSSWSTTRKVRIKFDPPTPLTPVDTSVVGDLLPTFTWSAAVGATSYTIQISKESDMSPLVINKTVTLPTYMVTANLLPATTYYWHVKVNGSYGPSSYSVVFSFTTP